MPNPAPQAIVAMTAIYTVTLSIFPGFLAEDVSVGAAAWCPLGGGRVPDAGARRGGGGYQGGCQGSGLRATSSTQAPAPGQLPTPDSLTPPPSQNRTRGSWSPVILFLIFNIGDLVGKLTPHFNLKPTQTALLICCASRVVFLPAFFCELEGGMIYMTRWYIIG